MRVMSIDHPSAFSPYVSSEASVNLQLAINPQSLPDMCIVCVDMARDTPGAPMSRPRDLASAGTTTTVTSGAFHAAGADSAAIHGHALQQKILQVMWSPLTY